MRWEEIQTELRYKLGDLFSHEQSIRAIVRDVDSTLEGFVIWDGNAVDCWSGILKEVRKRQYELRLVDAAQRVYSQDGVLQQAKDKIIILHKTLALEPTSAVTSSSRPPQSLRSKFIHNIFGMRDTNRPVVDTRTCIFISHNAMEGTSAEEVLNDLSRGLENAGFMVLLDTHTQRPQFSEEWRRAVYLCIQQCHAAVVLFSESALKSVWVEYEAKMLSARKYLDHRFEITSILLPSVDQGQLAKCVFPANVLEKLQVITEERTPTSIIEQETAPTKDTLPDNPLQKLAAVIAPWLNKLDLPTIRSVAQELGKNVSDWPEDIEHRKTLLAQELLKTKLADAYNAMNVLASKLEQKHAEHIVTILAPSWIDERAVAPIPEIVRRPLTRNAMCLNSEDPLTGNMYILRACNTFPGWQTIDTLNASGEDQFEALEQQILAGFRKTFVDEDASDTYIKRLLRVPRTTIEPFIVLIHGYLDREVLRILRTQYVGVTFFLLCSDESIDEQELERNNIELLLPLLDHQQEDDAHAIYWATRKVVKNCFRY